MSGTPDLRKYSTHFDEIQTEERETIIDLNAINPLSQKRDNWQNATDTRSEHKLSTTANTDDTAYVETAQRGQYTAGFMSGMGMGVRIPELPTGDSTMRWGYYNTNSAGEPKNGFYFGADSTGVFVARAADGAIEKVYQDKWSHNTFVKDTPPNPSDDVLDLSEGYVFHIDFTYYGYGPIEMQILADDGTQDAYGAAELLDAHVFHVQGETSTKNTNLPIEAEIVSGGTNNDALDLFLGGRQFSVYGSETTNNRYSGHYRGNLTTVDDTAWYPAISFKMKDGSSNIGSGYDFTHVLGKIAMFAVTADANSYRWQIRIDTEPDTTAWETPETHVDTPDETAFKVDTSATSITDGAGNLTGTVVDAGSVTEGRKNEANIEQKDVEGQVTNGKVVTLLFQASPTNSGTLSEIFFKLAEKW